MSFDLCKYKDIFGKPGEGAHSYRIFNIAVIDVVMTFVAAYLTTNYFNFNLINTIIIFFIVGIIFHRLFCVRTTIDKLLFHS